MKLKLSYEKETDIPSGYSDLFTEKDGKFVLTEIEGMQTTENVQRLEASLSKERKDHKETKAKLAKFGDRDPDKLQTELDELEELRLKTGDNADKKTEELVEQRVKVRTAPLEREVAKLKETNENLTKERDSLSGTITRGKIEAHLRKAAETAKITTTAVEDVIAIGSNLFEITEDGAIIAKDGGGLQAGLTPDIWLTDQQKTRPHWWAASQGGGAGGGKDGGGGAKNPWSKDHWNVTEQGKYVRLNGMEKANAMAAAAGSKVGATGPATKH